MAVHYAVGEGDGLSDEALLEMTYRANRRLTESRMYRALATVASPQLLIKGASMSWGLLHKGTNLKVSSSKGQADAAVTHPPNVWPRLAHESAALGFKAVIEAAHGREVTSRVVESTPEGARFEVRWK